MEKRPTDREQLLTPAANLVPSLVLPLASDSPLTTNPTLLATVPFTTGIPVAVMPNNARIGAYEEVGRYTWPRPKAASGAN